MALQLYKYKSSLLQHWFTLKSLTLLCNIRTIIHPQQPGESRQQLFLESSELIRKLTDIHIGHLDT